MEALILKNGKAVKSTNLTNCKFSIEDGMLVSFTSQSQNRKVCYFDESDFNNEIISKNINFKADYYFVDEYATFSSSPTEYNFSNFLKKGNYNDFVFADNDNEIKIRIISTNDLNAIYKYANYTFNHNINNNYLLNIDGTIGFNPILYDNNPEIIAITPSSISSDFFDNHKSSINNDAVFYKKIVICCVRIDMIIEDIFSIYNENLIPNDEVSNLVTSFLNSFEDRWRTSVFYDNLDSHVIKINKIDSLANALITFYAYSFQFQKDIKVSNSLNKLKWLSYLAHPVILTTVNPYYKIKLLSNIANSISTNESSGQKEFSIKTILSLIDSFVEENNNSNNIDIFLEKMVDEENGVIINLEVEKENESPSFITTNNHVDNRNKISLFEFIYRKITPGVFVQLWRFSDLNKKINSTFNIFERNLDARSLFITHMYTLWVKSSFNPTKGDIYNNNYFSFTNNGQEFLYSRRPATTFSTNQDDIFISSLDRNKAPLIINVDYYYIHALGSSVDTIKTRFSDFNRILVMTNDIRHANLDPNTIDGLSINTLSQFNTIGAFFSFGYYKIFQAIQVVYSNANKNKAKIFQHSWNEIDGLNTQNYIPAFLFHYMQQKEDEEFIYNLTWINIEAFYNGLPASRIKIVINQLLNTINSFFGYFEDEIDENEVEFINQYASTCSTATSNNEFCSLINIFCFWFNQKQVSKSEILDKQIQDSASDIIMYVEANGWPSDFNDENAKSLIESLGEGSGGICSDLKQIIVNSINEENQNSATNNHAPSFSLYDIDNNILYSDQDYEDVCNHVANLDIYDDFDSNSKKEILVQFLFNAHRIGKQANASQVMTRLSLWAEMKKPIAQGGRNKIPYIFGLTITQAQSNYNIFLSKMNELYGHYGFLNYQDKRIGGSSLYKSTNPKPGDLDMYLFINNTEINSLIEQFSRDWEKLANTTKDRPLSKKAKGFIKRVRKSYDEKGFIYGYLIIKHDMTFHIMSEDRFNEYYTSTLINFGETKKGFDITIKNKDFDNTGNPPYIIFNL